MTMIDEDVLSKALNEAANEFEVSTRASDRILAEAEAIEPPKRSNRVPTLISEPSRGRTYLVAAAIVVVVAGVSVPLIRSESSPNRTVVSGATLPPSNSAKQLSTVSGSGFASPSTPSPSHGNGEALTASGATASTKSASTNTVSQKIESTGSMSLKVRKGHVERAFSTLSKLATRDGGFVSSTQANVGSRTLGKFSFGTIVVEVPQKNFAKLVAQAQGVGHETSVRTSSNDVTAQYVDLQAHITALDASRRQYLVIMTKATTINGILAVQSQLDGLQSQIEQLQGQLNVLSHETTYGTLTVNVAESGHHVHKSSSLSGFAKAWHDSVKGFLAGFQWLVRLAGPALFAVLTLGGLWTIGRYVGRTLRRRRI
ncbi:MAG TPA: DUF4349 domain-containing protein [Acidimicrobiales bacterium]|jgi:hypothetical protein|nr:DUF4349 domain-containing protein [Acidimicrobiales bacterium]